MEPKIKNEIKQEDIKKIQELLKECVTRGIKVHFKNNEENDVYNVNIDLTKPYDIIKHRLMDAIKHHDNQQELFEKEEVIVDYYLYLLDK